MPVELHERLSEFSYGYGVTSEVERRLRQRGAIGNAVLPSLLRQIERWFTRFETSSALSTRSE